MQTPHRDDFDTLEDYEEALFGYEIYCEDKVDEIREEKAGINLINESTEKELRELNKELEKDSGE